MAGEEGKAKGPLGKAWGAHGKVVTIMFLGGALFIPFAATASAASMNILAASVGATSASTGATVTAATATSFAAPGTGAGVLTSIYNPLSHPQVFGQMGQGFAGILASGFDLVASPVLSIWDPTTTATEAIATSWNSPTPAMDWFYDMPGT